ncbi:MAG: signal peptide peptidase SppA [Ignavibacteria bacterium]|nr:signal peptide peptidase SppA [Ignavibacteria bacterium]
MENVQPKKKSFWPWFWGIFGVIFLFMIIGIFALFIIFVTRLDKQKDFWVETEGSGKGKIAVVELNYAIFSSEPIVRQFKKFGEDKEIKAILLRIDSPGGGVAASQEMYEIIKWVRDVKKKPVVVSVGSIAASGGYYAACGSSYIVSNPGSLVGSIGVIAQFISIKDLADKLGITETTIKSGNLKDAGSPFRQMNDSDKAYFQDIIMSSYDQFFNVVSTERKIDSLALSTIANGRVFTGEQGMKLGLVDELGTFEDAIRITGEKAGIEGKPQIVRERERRYYFDILYESMFKNEIKEVKDELTNEFINTPILQYKFVK